MDINKNDNSEELISDMSYKELLSFIEKTNKEIKIIDILSYLLFSFLAVSLTGLFIFGIILLFS